MKIFITGAAGYLGRAVARELARAGHEVHALVRSARQADFVRSLGAHALVDDLANPQSYTPIAAAADAIVHLASPPGVEASRFALDSLLEAARTDRVRHFLYTSVLFILGDTPHGADEHSPAGGDHYAERSAFERDVLAAETQRLTCSVVRPGMVYGGGEGGTVSELFRSALAGRAEYVGDGMNRWALVHRDDVASLFRFVLENRATGVFHATDGVPMTVRGVAERVVDLTGSALAPVPLDEARSTLGRFADALCLDQPVRSVRSRELGWRPSWPSFAECADAALEEFTAEASPSPVARG